MGSYFWQMYYLIYILFLIKISQSTKRQLPLRLGHQESFWEQAQSPPPGEQTMSAGSLGKRGVPNLPGEQTERKRRSGRLWGYQSFLCRRDLRTPLGWKSHLSFEKVPYSSNPGGSDHFSSFWPSPLQFEKHSHSSWERCLSLRYAIWRKKLTINFSFLTDFKMRK